jgi:adenylate cyclase
MTHSVRWQLGKALATRFIRVTKILKSIDEPMEIWIWSPSGLADEDSVTEALSSRVEGENDRPSIVVLPFDDLSGTAAVKSFADGIVEEITATLSRVRDFTVIARNSAYAFKSRPVDLRDVSRLLGVRYVLEGGVRKSGN